jgi:glutamate N-acetyltransferase / amino-acid N-acetyltransferase
MAPKVSPLAPLSFPHLSPIDGMMITGLSCQLRYKGRPDVMVAAFPKGAVVAGVLTTSKTAACSIDWCRRALDSHQLAHLLIVNAGNANAYTGDTGYQAMMEVITAGADLFGCDPLTVYQNSTGVIGVPLQSSKIVQGLPAARLALQKDGWQTAATAICTTDTFPKGATTTVHLDSGQTVTIHGFAKGSGMIAPNMATMLGYIFTDALVDKKHWQAMLTRVVDNTFNAITVDSDTSTNDAVLAFATRQGAPIDSTEDLAALEDGLYHICEALALQIVRDGEGATKLITVDVSGAESTLDAKKVAFAIANSPLVKTAIAGEDANWGRVLMAVGKSGANIIQDRIILYFGDTQVTQNGMVLPSFDEALVDAHLKGQEILISVELGMGSYKQRVWTCDLTHGYIDINGSYRS